MTTGRSASLEWQTPDGLDLSGAVGDIVPALERMSAAIRGRAWVEDLDGLPVAGTQGGCAGVRLPLHVAGTPVGALVLAGPEAAAVETIGALAQGHLCQTLESSVTIAEFVETTARQWKEINFLLDVSRSLDPTRTASQLCATVLQRLVRVLGARGGTVRLVDGAGGLETAASAGLDRPHADIVSACGAIEDWVFTHERPLLVDTAKDLPAGVARRALIETVLDGTAILSAPLPGAVPGARQHALGALSVTRERGRGRFTAEDLKLLQTAAVQISVAIHHTELMAEAKEAARLRREVEMAAQIQARLLPQTLPRMPGLEMRGWYRPATVVGGDYYDVIPVGTTDLYFAIADISGHGVASALFMSNARSVVRALLAGSADLGAVAEALNQRILEDSGDSGMFLTAILGRYDGAVHQVTLVNCGHNYPVLVRDNGEAVTPEAGSPPVGMLPVLGTEDVLLDLGLGDLLFLYTDGLVEARGEGDEMFGLERAVAIVRDGRHEPLDVLGDRLLEALQRFQGGPDLEDDLTMLMIRRVATGGAGSYVDG